MCVWIESENEPLRDGMEQRPIRTGGKKKEKKRWQGIPMMTDSEINRDYSGLDWDRLGLPSR